MPPLLSRTPKIWPSPRACDSLMVRSVAQRRVSNHPSRRGQGAAPPATTAQPLREDEGLESGHRREPDGQRLPGRDVVVAVGGRPITLVEDVFYDYVSS